YQPVMEVLEDRARSLLSQRMPCRDERLVLRGLMLLLGLSLHVVEQADPRQRPVRPRRVAGPGLVELPPRVHHAPDLEDLPRGVQPVEDRGGCACKCIETARWESLPGQSGAL